MTKINRRSFFKGLFGLAGAGAVSQLPKADVPKGVYKKSPHNKGMRVGTSLPAISYKGELFVLVNGTSHSTFVYDGDKWLAIGGTIR